MRTILARMRINITSVFVDDQEKALKFYTEKLGFKVKHDVPAGGARWLTVVAPEDPDGTELLLEPAAHPAAKPFKEALFKDQIPFTQFAVTDVQAEYDRLTELGVEFQMPPTDMDTVIVAVLNDTCGNWIQIAQYQG